ncbi:MAG: lipoate--protein ligase [Bacteroidaceae bacterium]|nr:lipoate--protein ligase [Bacteroidaceae bacterium]
MTYVALPEEKLYRLPFYLAMEEYVAREFPAQDYFFMWQVEPTVIFGRNQLVDSEVDCEYCKSNGIEMYRRKSGGGCVYADMSNIMLSYITPSSNVNFTFNRYMLMVEHTLQRLGVDARTTGRNDILVDGMKVSGNAFYHLPGRSIVHGTMLYDTNIEHMARATTPSDVKLKSKGVASVRQHVTTLNKYIALSIEELKETFRSELCNDERVLTAADIAAIEDIEKEYYTYEFIYGNNPAYSIVKNGRIEGVGEFRVSIDAKDGVVRKVNLAGDFFIVGDIDSMLLAKFKGIRLEREALERALEGVDCGTVIMNLKKEQLINLLTD